MTNSDVIIGIPNEEGLPGWIMLSERLTKTRRGACKGARDLQPTIYLNDNPEHCMVRPFLEFQRRKPAEGLAPEKPMFLACNNLQNPANHDIWFAMGR